LRREVRRLAVKEGKDEGPGNLNNSSGAFRVLSEISLLLLALLFPFFDEGQRFPYRRIEQHRYPTHEIHIVDIAHGDTFVFIRAVDCIFEYGKGPFFEWLGLIKDDVYDFA
jgi:hypothetical protein